MTTFDKDHSKFKESFYDDDDDDNCKIDYNDNVFIEQIIWHCNHIQVEYAYNRI